jgi:hypothetical protein
MSEFFYRAAFSNSRFDHWTTSGGHGQKLLRA